MSHKSGFRNWKVWLGVLISTIALGYFLSELRFPEQRTALWNAFRRANYLWLIPSILVMYVSVYLRGMRWQLLFRRIRHVSYNRLFGIEMVGFMGNSIYPLRAGELMRAYLLGRREKIGLTTSIATIAMERLFDLVMVVICFVAVSRTIADVGAVVGSKAAKTVTGQMWIPAVLILGAGFVALYAPKFCERILSVFLKVAPHHLRDRILHLYRQFVLGLESLRDPKAIVLGGIYTVLIWFTIAYSEYLVVKSFGLDMVGIGLMETVFIMTVLAVAVALPQAPGYIGIFQLAVAGATNLLLAKQPYSEMLEKAQENVNAFAIMLWFVQMIPIIVAGFISLKVMGLSLSELKHDAEVTEEELEKIEEKA